jgi:hypothetical protein
MNGASVLPAQTNGTTWQRIYITGTISRYFG